MAFVEGVWCWLLDTVGFLDRFESVNRNSTLSFHVTTHSLHLCAQNMKCLVQKYAIWDAPMV